MTARPCVYPKCGAPNGDPELTSDGVCQSCQRRFTRLLGWLVMDWVNIHATLPTPARRNQQERRNVQQSFGHPAEWASDTAADIAAVLNEAHDGLADHLRESPAPNPAVAEQYRVRAAWNYLECRIPELSRTDFAYDIAAEMLDLHGRIRSRLGLTRPRQILPTPCPACELRTLYRTIDIRRDYIECGSCGHVIREEHYPFYTRMVLDLIIDDAA
jgi:Zn ribbon nucleic-acid-binding protein